VTWWSPDPRGILELDGFHVSRSLQKKIRRGVFKITRDQAFSAVMEGCAAPAPGRPTTWITRDFIAAYAGLHQMGHAHSVECWLENELVGGVYGVQIGAFFAAESMFHRTSDASKVALYWLVEHLRARDFALLDVQMVTPHTEHLGARAIPRNDYLERLHQAIQAQRQF
jgi:leucyl/phenylalanyl-tRNA--protein transferase